MFHPDSRRATKLRPHFGLPAILALGTLSLLSLLIPSFVAALTLGQVRELAAPIVRNVLLTPDGNRAIYVNFDPNTGFSRLLSVPFDGGAPTPLGAAPAPTQGAIDDVQLSTSGNFVVWLARSAFDAPAQLYSVAPAGGPVTRLNGDLGVGQAVIAFRITPDSSSVIYEVGPQPGVGSGSSELYLVPIAGGQQRLISAPTSGEQGVRSWTLSTNGSRLVYALQASSQPTAQVDLFSVSLPNGNPVALPFSTTVDEVGQYEVTPDGATVLFVRRYTRPDTLISFELSKAPAAGGAATVITPSTSSMNVLNFVITPDSQRAIVYVGGNGNPDLQDLWSVPLNGSAAVKLDAALNDGDQIGLYKVSPDSARVVFWVQDPINGGFLYSVPVTGGALTTYAPQFQGPGIRSTYFITPDSARIVFVEQARYYSAPIDGSAQRIPISAEQEGPSYNDTLNVQFTRDSAYMLFRGRTAGDTATRLFITPLATNSVGSALSGDVAYVGGPPDAQDGGLVSFRQSADSSRVIFRAGADQFSGRALYATTISGLGIVKDKRVYLPALNR